MSGVVEGSVRVMSHAELASELAAAFTAFRTARPRARYIEVPLDLLAERCGGDGTGAPSTPARHRRHRPRWARPSSCCAAPRAGDRRRRGQRGRSRTRCASWRSDSARR